MNIRKLRQISKKYLGFYLWKDVSPEYALDQFQIIDDKFQNENDVIKFCNTLGKDKIPSDKPQWEIKFTEDYTDTTSLLFIKCHHSLTDGVGIVTLFAFLNDESFCPKKIPNLRKITLLQTLMVSLFTPIALIFQYSTIFIHFVKEKSKIIHTPSRELSGTSVFLKSKNYDFNDIRK
mmetsp:Transcript_32588/g.28847  ORF Transcript_32588/g.28847 Transcript_32588/m.28847 type:complete len:177 (-) Transcript_32588:623-1153(-)